MAKLHIAKPADIWRSADGVFITFIGLLLLLVPITPVIHALELRPNVPGSGLLLEPWRLLSAHLIHSNWNHLGINLLNLILIRMVFWEWLSPTRFLGFISFSGVFISLGLWWLTDLNSYVGFSGVFYGLLAYLLLSHWALSKTLFSLGIALLVSKVIYEQIVGANAVLAAAIGRNIAVDAHLLGLISGLSAGCHEKIRLWRQSA